MKSAMGVVPWASEPAGNSTLTSIEPGLPNSERFLGPFTSNLPSAYVTLVCCAARTSASSAALLGSTSTTVSMRLLAAIRAEPTSNSRVTEIGSGVSKVGMAVPSSWLRYAFPPVGRVKEK